MIEQDAQAMVDNAWEPENAVKILEKLLFRPAHRANGKSLMTAGIDMALCRAIVALKKEIADPHQQWTPEAKWLPRDPSNDSGDAQYYCSHCKTETTAIKSMYYNYCYNCGRVMTSAVYDMHPQK